MLKRQTDFLKFNIDEYKNICQYIENSLEILQDIVVDSPIERAIRNLVQ